MCLIPWPLAQQRHYGACLALANACRSRKAGKISRKANHNASDIVVNWGTMCILMAEDTEEAEAITDSDCSKGHVQMMLTDNYTVLLDTQDTLDNPTPMSVL